MAVEVLPQGSQDPMQQGLERVGLERYLQAFVRHGFDSWEALTSATESDFEAVGVKLGHRRKLQRAFANENSSSNKSANTRADLDTIRPRIYRRHPKPDKNAPTRPLTAYVRFSNEQRDVYKDNGWTFTELTRQIGHDWRTLDPEPRQIFVDAAEADKNAYRKSLWKYRQTASYHEYARYLEEFNRQNPKPQGQQSRRSSIAKSISDQSPIDANALSDLSQADMGMPDIGPGPLELNTSFEPYMHDSYYPQTPNSYTSLDSSPTSASLMPLDVMNSHLQMPLPYPWLNPAMPMEDVCLDNSWTHYIDLEAGP